MFRSFFISLSKSSWVRQFVTSWPIAWRMANRFVAGETLEDAIRVIQVLNSTGINATLDHLGEHTDSPEASIRATKEILIALETLHQINVKANISIKLTQIGLNINKDICAENLRTILKCALQYENFIRIDMEDSKATQATLDLLFQMREEGFLNLGIVLQSYLYRSQDDIEKIIKYDIPVRLCKGAYKEASNLAYPRKRDVDTAFDRLTNRLLQSETLVHSTGISDDGRFPPRTALATHDENRIAYARGLADQYGLAKEHLEFQMLYGIRRELQQDLANAGFPVRVYVPYGTEWYPYFMRRLAERPANVWFFITNLLRN